VYLPAAGTQMSNYTWHTQQESAVQLRTRRKQLHQRDPTHMSAKIPMPP